MSKRAFITGITGQDGAYLARLLLDKDYEVYGGYRRTSGIQLWRLEELGIRDAVELVPLDLLEISNIFRTLEYVKPDEIYNLAAQSFVGLSFEQPIVTAEVDAIGTLRLLEAVRTIVPDAKFYQASSSEMFGNADSSCQDEATPLQPRSPYGVSKAFSHWTMVNYREAYGMFAVSGILFNHESPLRGEEFVTRKITRAVANIKHKLQEKLYLGNLDVKRDWGYAADYVNAIYMMMQNDTPNTFVISTGVNHSVREFAETAFRMAGMEIEWEGEGPDTIGIDKSSGRVVVEISPEFYRPAEINSLRGDSTKAHNVLEWHPETSFEQLVEMMTEADMRRVISRGSVL